MIAYLKGVLLERHPAGLVIDIHGVGYLVQVPVSTYARLPRVGGSVELHVHTQVREDAIQLYGFAIAEEKRLFERLIAVNGVGPKLALAILSGLPAESLSAAIRSGDLARLTAIPGIGRKTAERLVVELRDKLPAAESSAGGPAATPTGGVADDVISALVNLGYPAPSAAQAVQRVLQSGPDGPRDFDSLFLQCMKAL